VNPMPKMILAIDDDENFLVTIKDMLEDEGYSVVTLSDPMRAEEYIEKYHPDLMIIDIFMPKRTGFNILEDFREKRIHERLPKIFLTCLDDDIERMTARARGVEKYITKPFLPQEFIKKVKECFA
jgi:two-component system cell cycle response regulator